MSEQRLEIVSDGLTLKGVLHTPESVSWPLVILCHGFLSHKDSSKYKELAQVFSQEGIAAIRFDFRGCGESEGSLSESSPSGRWRDLQKVIDTAVISDGFNGRLGLLGSSLGGYLALLEASRNPQIRCVSVWSTPSHLRDLAKRLPEVAPVEVSPESLEELRRVELLPQLAKVRRVLVLHGEKDRQVPPEHGSRLLAALHKPKALHFLENGDHRFSQAEVRQKAVRLSLEWFHQFL